MEFIAKCIPPNELHNFARLGTLSITINNFNLDYQPNKTVTYSTPLCLQYTKAASVPHLSWDLVKLVGDDNCPALISIANTFSMKSSFDSFQGGISSFANINSERPVVLTLEDKLMPSRSGFNGKKGVSIWTDSGRKQVDVKQLVDFVNKYKPNVCHVFGDGDTFTDSSNKRNFNSVIHSLHFLDSFMLMRDQIKVSNLGIIGTIEGGYDVDRRMHSVEETRTQPLDAYLIDGFKFDSFQHDLESEEWTHVESILIKTIEALPKNKPRAVFGPLTPHKLIKLYKCGIDIFDSSYCTLLSDNGQALIFNYLDQTSIILDMCSPQYQQDLEPILVNCKCYTCSNNFTRAYINHLLNTSEMLAQVLLMLHNLTTYYQIIRDLKSDNERLIKTHESNSCNGVRDNDQYSVVKKVKMN